jgi:hypothetical protein
MSINGDAVIEAATCSEVGSKPANAATPNAHSNASDAAAATAISDDPGHETGLATLRRTRMTMLR